jgi:hypothetical protein
VRTSDCHAAVWETPHVKAAYSAGESCERERACARERASKRTSRPRILRVSAARESARARERASERTSRPRILRVSHARERE